MKRWTSLLLCAALLGGLAMPAFAEKMEGEICIDMPVDTVQAEESTENARMELARMTAAATDGLPIAPMRAEVAEAVEDLEAAPEESGSGDAADARLARVTQLVKDRLELDTEVYTSFEGYVSEAELGTTWNLNWNAPDLYLNVNALEDGTVVGYWFNDNTESYSYSSYLPVFPKTDPQKAKAAAQAFLDKILDPATESVELADPTNVNSWGRSQCTFNGNIKLNGLASPLSYYITVRTSDNAVISFHRDAPSTSFLGNIPSKTPAVSQSDAANALKTTLNLELRYVTSEDNEKKAVLRYVPKDQQVKYVDAQTGALVDPSNAKGIYYGDAGVTEEAEMSMAADMANGSAKRALTQVELEGVEKLEGVLPKETLDRLIRAESAYKLDGFNLSTANYRLVKAEDAPEGVESVYCTLRYVSKDSENGGGQDRIFYGETQSRTFSVNARTGEVRSLYGSGSWDKNRVPAISPEQAEEIAANFWSRFFRSASQTPLYDKTDNTANGAYSYGFTFVRQVNGYFFPENAASVEIDCMTGAVCGVNYAYDYDVSFDAPKNLISAETALNAWMDTYDVTLAYRYLSKELNAADGALESKLIDIGYTQFYSLFLSYGLERETNISGIDAKSGAPVEPKPYDNTISYRDVDGVDAEADILRLASYRVGYDGGLYRPEKALTQWDAVCLLASTQGYRIDPDNATDDQKNDIYSAVYRMGALKRDERNDNALLNRGDVIKLLLNAAGYGSVAKLNGIFTCSYTDKADIPAADMGYAALAEGLGLASGTYNANGAVNRAALAVLLCRVLDREA